MAKAVRTISFSTTEIGKITNILVDNYNAEYVEASAAVKNWLLDEDKIVEVELKDNAENIYSTETYWKWDD